MSRYLARAVLLLIWLGAIQSAYGMESGLVNGGFEDSDTDLSGWIFEPTRGDGPPDRITKSEAVTEIVADPHSGKHSLHVRWDMPETDHWDSLWTLTNSAKLNVKPGETYTVTAWLKGKTGFNCGKVWMEVNGLADGTVVERGVGRDMRNAMSTWQPLQAVAQIPDNVDQIQVRFTGGHNTDLLLDDVEVRAGAPAPWRKAHKPLVQGHATRRVQEKLDRGVVAVPVGGRRVYVGWRLLDTDPANVAFNVYRRSDNGTRACLNAKPVGTTTDFLDENPPAGDSAYFVRRVVDGKEGPSSESAAATPDEAGRSYISVKMAGDYDVHKVGIGDLDGDGRYEYVIKQPYHNIDPWIGDRDVWRASPGTYKIEAYRQDGTLLWRHDMGWSIEMGIWFSPHVVYDLDGDGCAEVALKAGEGDPRDADGRVWTGPEYLLILDGKNGRERARVAWPPREGYIAHESLNRNQLCVAYLDGKTPCLVVERGTYATIRLVAYTFHDEQLHELWRWDDREEQDLLYTGQGAHCVHAADVDNDGRDEIIIGAAAVDDNGTGLWSTSADLLPLGGMYGYGSGSGRGHPDHCVVGDLNPTRPGLEVNICYEPRMLKHGMSQVDAGTGNILWSLDEETRHCHYGLTADIDPAHPGVEFWGGDERLERFWLFTAQGEVLSNGEMKQRLAVYWDADTQREIWNRDKGRLIHHMSGREYETLIEGKPIGVADVLGDWREEFITSVPGELRIYTTTIPAEDRRVCLMRDPIYRLDVCQEAQGYPSLPAFKVHPGMEGGNSS